MPVGDERSWLSVALADDSIVVEAGVPSHPRVPLCEVEWIRSNEKSMVAVGANCLHATVVENEKSLSYHEESLGQVQ